MSELNALSLIQRHDGSYFYLVELGFTKGLYKYILVNWENKHISEPSLIFSHTKRSILTKPLKEFFDNNLLNLKRIEKYKKQNNCYIGGIDKINGLPVREFKEGLIVKPKYKIYKREDSYLLIEYMGEKQNLKTYIIYEIMPTEEVMNFMESKIYTEKDLLNLTAEEESYVLNNLLKRERVSKKVKNNNGYIGTIEQVNGTFRKKSYEASEAILKKQFNN